MVAVHDVDQIKICFKGGEYLTHFLTLSTQNPQRFLGNPHGFSPSNPQAKRRTLLGGCNAAARTTDGGVTSGGQLPVDSLKATLRFARPGVPPQRDPAEISSLKSEILVFFENNIDGGELQWCNSPTSCGRVGEERRKTTTSCGYGFFGGLNRKTAVQPFLNAVFSVPPERTQNRTTVHIHHHPDRSPN
jgi:hypothetical protein